LTSTFPDLLVGKKDESSKRRTHVPLELLNHRDTDGPRWGRSTERRRCHLNRRNRRASTGRTAERGSNNSNNGGLQKAHSLFLLCMWIEKYEQCPGIRQPEWALHVSVTMQPTHIGANQAFHSSSNSHKIHVPRTNKLKHTCVI